MAAGCRIYLDEIPFSETGSFWVSFENDPKLTKSKDNIYGRCLPCIQNLYFQLQEGREEVDLGPAYHCWKITVVAGSLEECLHLLGEFEKRWMGGSVYGKLGSGRSNSATRVVVFQTENEIERDRIVEVLSKCLPDAYRHTRMQISRACAILYDDILGDWRAWGPVTQIRHPEKIAETLKRVRKTLFWSEMNPNVA